MREHEELFAAVQDLDVPQEIFEVLSQALSKEPEKRQTDCCVLLG